MIRNKHGKNYIDDYLQFIPVSGNRANVEDRCEVVVMFQIGKLVYVKYCTLQILFPNVNERKIQYNICCSNKLRWTFIAHFKRMEMSHAL